MHPTAVGWLGPACIPRRSQTLPTPPTQHPALLRGQCTATWPLELTCVMPLHACSACTYSWDGVVTICSHLGPAGPGSPPAVRQAS